MKTVLLFLAGALVLAACGSPNATPGTSSDQAVTPEPVERQYGKPADEVWDATLSAMKSIDLRIDVDRHDDLGSEIIARRSDGRPAAGAHQRVGGTPVGGASEQYAQAGRGRGGCGAGPGLISRGA
jgi:hypothetical protein